MNYFMDPSVVSLLQDDRIKTKVHFLGGEYYVGQAYTLHLKMVNLFY
jgi:hypothetical protein